ncbi:MAG: zinc ribbon domain-containing protein [Chloroflexi bacterium]|nr:zinc ribbon domain-containing protein [Chloroflexota bacterium]
MPIYEYTCTSCGKRFELLRPFSQADVPAACPRCESTASQRAISCFAAHVASGSGSEPRSASGGGGCAGCSRGSCSGCRH